jgi:Tol biopolymer transport system component
MVITSDRGGADYGSRYLDLYLATRPSTSAPWGTPVEIAGVNTSRIDGDARLVAGGLELYLSSRRTGSDGTDFYLATRSATTEAFSPAVPITELNSSDNETDPWISEDRRYILFTSDRTGNNEIYEATR